MTTFEVGEGDANLLGYIFLLSTLSPLNCGQIEDFLPVVFIDFP